MNTPEDLRRIDNNPDLLHVNVVNGKLWLSDDARDDIERFTGRSPETDSPRQMIEFLQTECGLLQARDERLGEREAKDNFLAFCALKGIAHAIETKFLGAAHVGAFEPEALISVFFRPSLAPSMSLN